MIPEPTQEDRQTAQQMMKEFMATFHRDQRLGRCPFIIKGQPGRSPLSATLNSYNECRFCGILFPNWAKENLFKIDNPTQSTAAHNCPCLVMTLRYVRKRARRFAYAGK